MGTEAAIDLRNVKKRFRGGIQALAGVNMKVNRGEIVGLLGPNGAGKSTLVKIMMTVVRASSAEGTILGHRVGSNAPLARIGYLPEHHRIPAYLTGMQVLHFYAGLSGVRSQQRNRKAAELLDIVGMTEWADKKISSYSKGMQQRIGLAQAMMNDPDLIVLDEPTDGVDPVGRMDIRNVLERLKHEGKTIFLNSHLLSELEMVCDHVSILVKGQVAMQGTIRELTQDSVRYEFKIKGAAPSWVNESDTLRSSYDESENHCVIQMPGEDPEAAQPIIDRLRDDNREIHAVHSKRESLEDLFMRAVYDPTTGKAMTPGAARNGGAS